MRKRPARPIDRKLFGPTESQLLDAATLDTPERILAYCKDKKFFNGHATDVRKLIEDNKELSLSFEDIGEYDAYIEKVADKKFKIVVNKKHSPTRQRFSMAHEYIHYQIHRDRIDQMPHGERILHRSEEKNKIEFQANQYAAQILMPEDTFFQIARATNGDITRIAKEFEVSPLAVRYQAKSLGIPGHGV